MKAPKKLYLHPTASGNVGASWLSFPLTDNDIEYTRTDTLEVKEVDLEKEYEKYYEQERNIQTFKLARHFFELGLKAQKGNKS